MLFYFMTLQFEMVLTYISMLAFDFNEFLG